MGGSKHAMKCIKTRIEPIRKKKQAVLRFLKKDVADLIAAGHDANAYRRIDALIVEMNGIFCYDLIEKFCETILDQLPTLQKQKECPEEIMEEIGSLIYAAARFPDLPELSNLRHVFVERYGSDMESSVSSEFADKIKKRTFPMEKKLRVMNDIAEEFSLGWDAETFDQQSDNCPTPENDEMKNEIHGNNLPSVAQKHQVDMEPKDIHVIPTTNNENPLDPVKMKPRNETISAVLSFEKPSRSHCGSPTDQRRYDIRESRREEEQNELDSSLEKEVVSVKPLNSEPANLTPPYTKSSANGYHVEETRGKIRNGYQLEEQRHEEEVDSVELEKQSVRPLNNDERAAYSISPPYTKPNSKCTLTKCDQAIQNTVVEDRGRQSKGGSGDEKPKPISVRTKIQKPMLTEPEQNDTVIDGDKHRSYVQGGQDDEEKTTATDSRQETENEIDDNTIYYGKILPGTFSEKKRRGGRKHDEEEKVMDKLLLQHSIKRTAAKELGEEKTRDGAVEIDTNGDCRINPVDTEVVSPPEKAFSRPLEPVSAAEAKTLNGGRVHPRLPDYDQLVARLAALRST